MSAEVIIAICGSVLAALAFIFVLHWIVNDAPMPCAADEVYVWVDHNTEAECVPATDHASHQGDGHGQD